MDSAGSSAGITRTSSEESEASSVPSAELPRNPFDFGSTTVSVSAEDEFTYKPKMTQKKAAANPFFGGASTKSPSEPKTFVDHAKESVNRIADLLKRLQSVEEDMVKEGKESVGKKSFLSSFKAKKTPEDKVLCKDILKEVTNLRHRTMSQVPMRHRQRLLDQVSSQNYEAVIEFPLLFGRCFNLSMNLNILGSDCLDATLATRILSDLQVIDTSLSERLSRRDEMRSDKLVDSLMSDLKIERGSRSRIGFL